MEPVGGRSTALRAALVALGLLLAACSGDDPGASATGPTTSAREAAPTTGDAATEGPSTTVSPATVAGDDAGPEAITSSSPSTTTTAPTTTTQAPATTAAIPTTTTTAPPPPTTTTTTAPPPTTTTTTTAPSSGPQHGTRNTGCEQYMYDRINAARADAGQAALAFDTGIQHIAIDWSDEMARTQTLAHNPDYGNQIFAARAQAQTAGENVGRGYNVETLFQAFMDSPGHRRNIESPSFSHVTLGCLTDGNGQLWVTQNFWG